MIGHDINYKVAKTVFDGRGGVTRFRPQPRQAALVAAGMLGRKSGGGVYDYALPSPRPTLVPGDRLPGLIRSALDSGAMEGVVTKLEANGCVVERTAALLPGILDVDGTCIAFGDGRRLADRVDADVLLDAVRDWEGFAAIGITARSAAALSAAGSLASALGVKALELPDRPGQIVLRTLAQLANAAADALSENVAHAEGIDIAMSLGANHPEGPVAWSSRFGIARLHAVLTNLAAVSGDPIYRPSAGLPLLQVSR
jgi:3-hydroxybutyryl-CoA dehydrogenase